ncbi:zinc finger protein 492-like [Aphidius gifuensis]|uniref:zinc finger protein 492-like n=1 Tax=Aphidius gifuensis TaxID=684658 RepID=UPI001CDBA856|nr:zinc finger protein 492-like [Aphidius gifuensis]
MCKICDTIYPRMDKCQVHIWGHFDMKPYKCNKCNFNTLTVTNIRSHIHVTCDICKRKFYSKGRLRVHILTHNKDKNLICKYCSQHFTTIEAVSKHYDSVHSHDYTLHFDAQYKCHLCTNVYKSSHILKEHILKHQGIRKYKCDVCDKSFAQQSHLAAHKAVHSDKRFICPGCEKAFNRQDNMKSHTKKLRSEIY